MERVLDTVYYNLDSPAAYSGVDQILREARKFIPTIRKKDVQFWLLKEITYGLHKPVRKKFPKRKYHYVAKDALWMADLMFTDKLAKDNDSQLYILTVIDIFTRKAWARTIPNKTSITVARAFMSILKEGRKPITLATDSGTEFLGSAFQKMLKQEGIKHYRCIGQSYHCSHIERWNRTIKSRIYKYLTKTRQYRYIEALPKLVEAYNNSYHRMIKTTPNLASRNPHLISRSIPKIQFSRPKFKPGDLVRISRIKTNPFEKAYTTTHQMELFRVKKVHPASPIMYTLEDTAGLPIIGRFYEPEISHCRAPDKYWVEKVIKTRKRNGRTEYFVKFQGYSDFFNSWVRDDD